jgi:hypothetical protein
MPRWLLPWLPPLALTVAVPVIAVSTVGGAVVLGVVGCVGLAVLRARYVRDHPPAELVKKPFWKL